MPKKNFLSEKLKEMRLNLDLSQQQVADGIGISRTALSQIELGDRKMSVDELEKFSQFFETPVEDFFCIKSTETKPLSPTDPNYIIKQIILYIAEKLKDKDNFGETLLNKLLYFIDFNHYEWTGELITGQKYVKQPYGPVPADIVQILKEMESDGQIKRENTEFHGFKQKKIKSLIDSDTSIMNEIDKKNRIPDYNYKPYDDLPKTIFFVDDVISKYGSWTASAITEWSHQDMPYKIAKNMGDEIKPEFAFYREPAYIANYHNLEEEDD